MKKARFYTLGCKLNQSETNQVKSIWRSNSFADECNDHSEEPEIVFVNGCAVTEKAAAKSRQLVRRLNRQFPNSILVAAGCMVQAEPDRIASIPGVDYVLGIDERYNLDWLADSYQQPADLVARNPELVCIPEVELSLDRSRPFLKIQDGCDRYCSYCIIPLLRGDLRSVPLENVVNNARILIQQGAHEIVLTGVRIGTWGWDLPGDLKLIDLVSAILELPMQFRLRLGSLEPWELDEDLVQLILTESRICPHLHVPLQHTSTTVLNRMNRPEIAKTSQLIIHAKSINPDIAIGTDIIAGFPGESDEEFNRLLTDLIELPISYIHVFSFSKRFSTPASHFEDQLSPQEIRERADKIDMVNRNKRSGFIRSQIGKRRLAIPDGSRENRQWTNAVTDNYIRVKIDKGSASPGYPVMVRIETDANGDVTGVIERSVT